MSLSTKQFSARVLKWFAVHGRKNLPRQKKRNAYKVWLSEVMLQQTQVATVIPYYEHFLKSFPTLESLAAASDDAVMAHWSGLGYYTRARNLHKTAKIIMQEHAGLFPKTQAGLEALPGIGRSTAGAIIAQAFKQRAAILDANVKRVLARFYAVEGWPGNKTVHDTLWQYAELHTPQKISHGKNITDYTQAMMDLGSLVCTRTKPQCEACPLTSHCASYASGNPVAYPTKKPKKITPVKEGYVYILKNAQGQVYLEKRPPQGIWGGLWSLPQSSEPPESHIPTLTMAANSNKKTWKIGELRRHTFSHYHFDFQPVTLKVKALAAVADKVDGWFDLPQAQEKGLPAPIRKLLLELLNLN